MKLYEASADAFLREQVATCFALLGDANMHWAGALADRGMANMAAHFSREESEAIRAYVIQQAWRGKKLAEQADKQ